MDEPPREILGLDRVLGDAEVAAIEGMNALLDQKILGVRKLLGAARAGALPQDEALIITTGVEMNLQFYSHEEAVLLLTLALLRLARLAEER